MIATVVHLLQCAVSIWLALSVIYPAINEKILLAAEQNSPVAHYRSSQPIVKSSRMIVRAAVIVLSITALDILLLIF